MLSENGTRETERERQRGRETGRERQVESVWKVTASVETDGHSRWSRCASVCQTDGQTGGQRDGQRPELVWSSSWRSGLFTGTRNA